MTRYDDPCQGPVRDPARLLPPAPRAIARGNAAAERIPTNKLRNKI
ncbi:MAG: hypothetical protein WD063_15480 [Pirellulales bacterium]